MLSADGKTASDISEFVLTQTGKALLSRDFEAFAPFFHMPHAIETPDRKTVLGTRAALRRIFDHVVADHAEKNITNLIRYVEMAKFHGPLKIESLHITHLMSGNIRAKGPFSSYSILEFIDNRWQATSTQYAVDRNTTVGRALYSDQGLRAAARCSGTPSSEKGCA